jgi:2-polyprenyl-3-methyl-5-hydroxy-6-metoxy-1,4-benzoquinol methylase
MTKYWDERYSSDVFVFGVAPHDFLAAQSARFRPGMRALAVADGEGRNAVWLARQGLDVICIDASEFGLAKAHRLAAAQNVALRTMHLDIREYAWPAAQFDVITSIFVHFDVHDREYIHSCMQRSLKPGGLLVLVAFTPEQLALDTGGPHQIELLYTADEMRSHFAGMIIHHLDAIVCELHEGEAHTGLAAVLRLLAEKPRSA